MFMSTAPRTNPRCVYPSPLPQLHPPPAVTLAGAATTESLYSRRKARKGATSAVGGGGGGGVAGVASVALRNARLYDSSSSDSDYEPLTQQRFRERNTKRGSRNALDRCSNPKTLDEVNSIFINFKSINQIN